MDTCELNHCLSVRTEQLFKACETVSG